MAGRKERADSFEAVLREAQSGLYITFRTAPGTEGFQRSLFFLRVPELRALRDRINRLLYEHEAMAVPVVPAPTRLIPANPGGDVLGIEDVEAMIVRLLAVRRRLRELRRLVGKSEVR